ncbi:MAG: hypothetical protein RLZZ499_1411, partial [Cyanobacteriota bacterium]
LQETGDFQKSLFKQEKKKLCQYLRFFGCYKLIV